MLELIKEVSTTVTELKKFIDKEKETEYAGADIATLHTKEIEDNSKFIQEHIGEFSFSCGKCHSILSSGGLPHWAIEFVNKESKTCYHIWSRQMFFAVEKGFIPLYIMAFCLETSIEGLRYTADEKGITLPAHDIFKEEEKLKELMLEFEKR